MEGPTRPGFFSRRAGHAHWAPGDADAVRLFSDAVSSLSHQLTRSASLPPPAAVETWLNTNPTLHRLPLLVIAAALHHVLTPGSELQLSGADVIQALTRRERARIDHIAQREAGWKDKAASRLVGLAACRGELDAADIRRLAAQTEIGLPNDFLDSVRSLGLMQDSRVLSPTPDLVAAEFLFVVLNDAADRASEWLWRRSRTLPTWTVLAV